MEDAGNPAQIVGTTSAAAAGGAMIDAEGKRGVETFHRRKR
jgi:hypothetical protein